MTPFKISYLFLVSILIAGACRKTNPASTNNNNDKDSAVVIQDTLNSWAKIPVYSWRVDDIWFKTPGKGFMISGSSIFSSSDSGKSWKQNFSTNQFINAFNLQFVDSLNGFVQGSYLLVTSDGGKTWTERGPAINAVYFQFINPSTGFYFAPGKGIFATHDGGSSWVPNLMEADTTATLNPRYPFYFLDTLRGFSMMNGNFYKTIDGGLNWNMQSTMTGVDFTGFFKMQFLDTMTGYCGSPAGLLKTIDGGKSWIYCFGTPVVDGGFSIPRFFDIKNGYLMTLNGIYKTTDGGQHWSTSCRIATGSTFSSIYFLDMNTGWASTYNNPTDSGYILRLK